LGESYGRLFAPPRWARALQRDQGIVVSGIVMVVSPMIEGTLPVSAVTISRWGAALQFPFRSRRRNCNETHALTKEAVAES